MLCNTEFKSEEDRKQKYKRILKKNKSKHGIVPQGSGQLVLGSRLQKGCNVAAAPTSTVSSHLHVCNLKMGVFILWKSAITMNQAFPRVVY